MFANIIRSGSNLLVPRNMACVVYFRQLDRNAHQTTLRWLAITPASTSGTSRPARWLQLRAQNSECRESSGSSGSVITHGARSLPHRQHAAESSRVVPASPGFPCVRLDSIVLDATPDALMKAVVDRYLKSGDFTGLQLHTSSEPDLIEVAKRLVADRKLEVMVSKVDYPNPHIRPWPSRRTIESQIESLDGLADAADGVVVYPTPSALKGVHVPARLKGHPFGAAMAKGRGTLELAYFSFDVLEPYRNDPRYLFRYWDFGVDMSIGDEAYLDDTELDRDKVSLSHLGFAYDLSDYDRTDVNTRILRRVAAFYGDLAKLTPEHQQRWKSYQVDDNGLEPHPAWWMTQMGHWADGIGPFEHLFLELENLNALWTGVFGAALFKHTDRPKDFGWLRDCPRFG